MKMYTQLATTLVTETQLQNMTRAVHAQLTNEFSEAWDVSANIHLLAPGRKAAPGDCVIALLDEDTNVPGALGYHSEEANGVKFGSILCKPCLQDLDPDPMVSVASCLSHEACEAWADLAVNVWALAPSGLLWAQEVCDPVESDSYTHAGVTVSNFVTPEFFDDNPPSGSKFDYMGNLKAPFSMDQGGYAVVWQPGKQPKQVFGKSLSTTDTASPERVKFRQHTKGRGYARTNLRLVKAV